MLPMQGMWVQSLVGELRFHMPWHPKKEEKTGLLIFLGETTFFFNNEFAFPKTNSSTLIVENLLLPILG